MTTRFISYSAPMVKARRAGLKTQTRRVAIKTSQPRNVYISDFDSSEFKIEVVNAASGQRYWKQCPYGQPGDRLRVKEAAWMWCERVPNGKTPTGRDKWRYEPMREAPIHYAADHATKPCLDVVSPDTGNQWGWRFKIPRFLPGWACRSEDEVVSVRVEHLNEISEADANAEGIYSKVSGGIATLSIDGREHMLGLNGEHRMAYMELWEYINGAGSWAANPWVWVVEFKRLEGGAA